MDPKAPSVALFPPAIRLLGDLTVLGNARIACEVHGRIRVLEHLEIDPVAVINGDLQSGSIHIRPGATVKGALFVGRAFKPVRSGLRRFLEIIGVR